jgi:hypothetical protein
MCCSPFVTQSLAADDVVREFKGGAWRPVGLTAREEGTSPTGLAGGTRVSGPRGSSLIGPHKCAVPRAKQELGVNKCTEQRITRGAVQAPEPLRLRRRQTQSGHLDVLALNASQYVVKRLLCWHFWLPLFPDVSSGRIEMSNRHATASNHKRVETRVWNS